MFSFPLCEKLKLVFPVYESVSELMFHWLSVLYLHLSSSQTLINCSLIKGVLTTPGREKRRSTLNTLSLSPSTFMQCAYSKDNGISYMSVRKTAAAHHVTKRRRKVKHCQHCWIFKFDWSLSGVLLIHFYLF